MTDMETPDTNTFVDAELPDASIPDEGLMTPDRVVDAWWFNTVRALCDSFAIEFCPDGSVAARFSFDDSCGGENPTSDEPYEGTVTWQSDTDFEVRLQTSDEEPNLIIGRFIESEDGPEFDQIEWTNVPNRFPWTNGTREAYPMWSSPRPADFVFCD